MPSEDWRAILNGMSATQQAIERVAAEKRRKEQEKERLRNEGVRKEVRAKKNIVQIATQEFIPLFNSMWVNIPAIRNAEKIKIVTENNNDYEFLLYFLWGNVIGIDSTTKAELEHYLLELRKYDAREKKRQAELEEYNSSFFKLLKTRPPDREPKLNFHKSTLTVLDCNYLNIAIDANYEEPENPNLVLCDSHKVDYRNYLLNKQKYLRLIGEYIWEPKSMLFTISPSNGAENENKAKKTIDNIYTIPGLILNSTEKKRDLGGLNFACDCYSCDCFTSSCISCNCSVG